MLTPRQQEALTLSAQTAIIANAGSGKTKVLVERYLAILLANPQYHPRDLVAITFTEQAARDLKRKILEELESRLKNASGDDARRLAEIRTLLGSAQISTIHAFCNQLLRSYPVEANVDASFGILMPPEDGIVLEEAIHAAFFRILEKAYADSTNSEAEFLLLFRTIGRAGLSNAMRSMIAKRDAMGEFVERMHKTTPENLLNAWDAAIQAYLKQWFVDAIDVSWYERCLEMADNSKKKAAEARTAFLTYQAAKDFSTKVSAGIALLKAFHTDKWDKLASNIVPKAHQEALELMIVSQLKQLKRIRSLAEGYVAAPNPEFDTLYASLMRLLIHLYDEVADEYEASKVSLGVLDHDDSLLKALALVRQPQIARELAARYKYILVDEYQDTDPVQFRIIEQLTALDAANNLTIVGDPKQSIYGFRNAELPLFFETVDRIERLPNSKLVELQENFRILPAPLAFINHLFSYVFEATPGSKQHGYLPLIQARPAHTQGAVEFLLATENDTENTEGDLIARKILFLTSDGSVLYRDIAILLRTRTSQGDIERSLRKHRIPFSVYGGTGFYARQEIVDILAYLQFLLDPTDDVALSSILRSPFFALSDTDLLKITVQRNYTDKTFWQLYQRVCKPDTVPEQWQRALKQISENLLLVGRLSAYQLVNKIYDETGIYAILSAIEGGPQALANLEKFASLALVNESAAFFGTFDFVGRVMLLSERDEQEAQAEIRSDDNTVRLMTIHVAKGLEFPVVFLPQLHRDLLKSDSSQVEALLEPDLGAVIPFPDIEHQHWAYKLAKHKKRERELEEEKRIFYVAATRARDQLICTAILTEKRPAHSYLRWIEEAFGDDLANTGLEALQRSVTIGVYEDGKTSQKTVELLVPINRALATPPLPVATLALDQLPEIDLKPVVPSISQSRYSPTQLLHFIECPTKYYLRYILGLPEEPHLSFDFEAADLAEKVKGTLLGQLVHSVLERANTYISSNGVNLEHLNNAFITSLQQLGIYDDATFEKYHSQVLSHVQRFLASELGQRALTAQEYYTEVPMRAMLNERQMLSGIIDRLFKNAGGTWEILDYKTDSTQVTKKKIDRYKFQLRFYAYLVSRFVTEPQDITTHLFFTHYGIGEKITFTQSELSKVGSELNTTVSHIRRDQDVATLAEIKRNYEHCRDCPYFRQSEMRCIADIR